MQKELGVFRILQRGTSVNLRPNEIAIAQRPARTLAQDVFWRYWLQTQTENRITPSGSYDFVKTPDGSIRVVRLNVSQDFSTHTNSLKPASYYSKVFTDAGVTNFKFVITPITK